jgi:hypothetical protein
MSFTRAMFQNARANSGLTAVNEGVKQSAKYLAGGDALSSTFLSSHIWWIVCGMSSPAPSISVSFFGHDLSGLGFVIASQTCTSRDHYVDWVKESERRMVLPSAGDDTHWWTAASKAGLVILIGILLWMLTSPTWRSWLACEFAAGRSWWLLAAFLIAALFLCALITAADGNARVARACVLRAPPPLQSAIQRTRGTNYMLMDQSPGALRDQIAQQHTACAATGWSALHFLAYAGAGFLAPALWPVSLGIGILWEVAETTVACHDWLDILYNTAGLLSGILLRRLLFGSDVIKAKCIAPVWDTWETRAWAPASAT